MPLHFCPDCQNMLIFGLQDHELFVRCRICGYEGPCQETILLTKTYKQGTKTLGELSDENVIYDRTLKRTIHYNCPNGSCITHKDEDKKEAVFARNSMNNLQQVMVCTLCKTKWQI